MKKVLKIILPIVLAWGLVVTGCSSGSSVARIGEPAPDFQLQDLDGQTVSLSDLQGRPVMLNFWATQCIPCRSEMSYLQEIYRESAGNPSSVVVLTINLGESHSTIEEFVRSYNLSLPVLLGTGEVVNEKYNIQYIPTTIFIDRDGIIQEKVIGAFPSKTEIEKRLSKITSE